MTTGEGSKFGDRVVRSVDSKVITLCPILPMSERADEGAPHLGDDMRRSLSADRQRARVVVRRCGQLVTPGDSRPLATMRGHLQSQRPMLAQRLMVQGLTDWSCLNYNFQLADGDE